MLLGFLGEVEMMEFCCCEPPFVFIGDAATHPVVIPT